MAAHVITRSSIDEGAAPEVARDLLLRCGMSSPTRKLMILASGLVAVLVLSLGTGCSVYGGGQDDDDDDDGGLRDGDGDGDGGDRGGDDAGDSGEFSCGAPPEQCSGQLCITELEGVGYEDCKGVKHDIVYVSCSGWGQFGPWSDRAGYDPAAQAASGWMALNGTPADGPTKAPTFLADDLAGMHGALGALAALHHRNATGEGQHVDVSLLDSLLFQSNGLLTLGAMGEELPRLGSEVAASCPTNSYACRDGHIYLAMILDRHWQVLCGLINRPDLAGAPGYGTNLERLANRDAVNQVVAQWCAQGQVEATLAALQGAGLVAARINSFKEAAQLEHLWERDMLQPTVVSSGQEVPITGPAAKFSRTPTRVRRPAPDSGQHTEEILSETGFDVDRIAELRRGGVV